jgi:hypothetical protein
VLAASAPVLALSSSALADVKVTDHPYVRHDGGTDAVIETCSDDAPGPSAGGERQANEPSVAIKPDEPGFIVASANDYCPVPLTADAWQGIYVSDDGGASWIDSLLPGYPGDTSGVQSPLQTNSGDPLVDWDLDGHLYAGGISFNRTVPRGASFPANGLLYAATYVRDPSAPLGIRYLRTVVVSRGVPANFLTFGGRFNDRPNMKVDDWASSPCANNVYMSWTLFPGGGTNQILFARSTDHGRTFSNPIKLERSPAGVQGSDVAVAPNGDVYVTWRTFAFNPVNANVQIMFVKSTDCGRTFSRPRPVSPPMVPSDRRDTYVSGSGARDCGDGPFLCVSEFVFHRISTITSVTVAPNQDVYVTWSQVNTVASNGDTYRPDGQSQVVYSKSTNGGNTWSPPAPIDAQAVGHQFWPDITVDKVTGELSVIYMDSRTDPSPYSPYRPPGNEADATSPCQDAGGIGTQPCDVLNTFVASSINGGASWSSTKVSTIGHQPNFEMFGARNVPFHGDYIWIDTELGTTFGAWSDNRDVVPGADPREDEQDGFDVLQCLDEDGVNTCPNAGGLDQNIYGAGL